MGFAELSTKHWHLPYTAQCLSVATLQEDDKITLALTCIPWHVFDFTKLGNHGAPTVGHCIFLSISLCLKQSQRQSKQFSKWKITDTYAIMKVCVKG